MIIYLPFIIPVLFAAIHCVEFTAIMARLAGIHTQSKLLGYTIQQAVYVGTRLFSVLLLPLLGLAVDSGLEVKVFQTMAVAALLAAAVISLVVYAMRAVVVHYFSRVIRTYVKNNNFILAFLKLIPATPQAKKFALPRIQQVFLQKDARKIFVQSAFVYAIYGTGLFLSFYFALLIPEYRASISQLSGVVNAFGAIVLTFYVEPRISRGIDANSHDAPSLVIALLLGRLIGIAILSQIILATVFWLT